ncbi:hypothetical protein [Terasakiella sp.]|uniref:hypothetical protein n=1 Tax=Terasakiella sp. TaxID=2034861 RepID=UPI003AA8BFA2
MDLYEKEKIEAEEQRRLEAENKQKNFNDLRVVINTTGGRRYIWRLLERFHFLDARNAVQTEHSELFIFEGMRSCATDIFNDVMELSAHDQKNYFAQMVVENQTLGNSDDEDDDKTD